MSLKQLVKAPLRPLLAPLLGRLESGTRVQLDETAKTLAGLRAELDGLQRAFPAMLAAMASGAEERSFKTSVDELARRVEFVRKEVLFELRYGRRPSTGDDQPFEPKVLNPAKLERMGEAIRLNLGAGHVGRSDYLNVDARILDGIDVVADIGHLPFEKGSIAEIYSAHVLEHFPLEQLRSVLMPYWVSLLRQGGAFVAVVPDMETMINEYVAGRMRFDELREVAYGAQEYEGDFHYNGYSQASLRALLEEAGLREVAMRAFARRNGMCYEMEIVGVRPAGPVVG
ncbi:MAG: class I SAM-dependent methyltransferase [Acidimicrobiales bacterium]